MSAIFLAFANDSIHRLPTLTQEDDQVYALLARRAAQQHYTVHRDSSATTRKIAEFLLLYRDTLSVFLYSGHAEKDALLLEDEPAQAEGIAQLLGQCPNLKLILLNGCSTVGQVKRLLQLPNHPVVIATSAPVNDFAASQFSIRFFQALSEQFDTIENAFQAGLGAAQLTSPAATRAGRQQVPPADPAAPLWGIYFAPEATVYLTWKLPTFALPPDPAGEPNLYLIEVIIKALAPYNEEAQQLEAGESRGKKFSLKQKREIVLKCFPDPISEQLRRLFANSQTDHQSVFYDKLGPERLGQLVTTYTTIIELTAFVILSQLWNALIVNRALQISSEQREVLKQFFTLSDGARRVYNFFPLIRTIREVFDQNEVRYFVEELAQISQTFKEHSDFYNACIVLETLKRQLEQKAAFEKSEADRLCIIAEEKLAQVLQQLGFMARYTMTSIKNINVLKYRHIRQPKYRHLVVELVASMGGMSDESRELQEFLDNYSVVLQRKDQDETLDFLNLSPFVIDEYAFLDKIKEFRLQFFHHYERAAQAFCYKDVYHPEKNLLIVRRQVEFAILKDQFDYFADLLFQTPMQSI